MSEHILTSVNNQIAYLCMDRPAALNSLSLEMVRTLTAQLLAWREDTSIRAVVIHSSAEKAFCAGGDIRFFYEVGSVGPVAGSALLEDFFSEEYALNHLIHFYPKPYIAIMNGVVMGGGMGVAQAGPACRLRIVTERTKMAMPEVNIGLFPDVGGGYFLSRCPGQIGTYLGLSGNIITAADALYADLADVFVPTAELPALFELLARSDTLDLRAAIRAFAAPFAPQALPEASMLARERVLIDRHFSAVSVPDIVATLSADAAEFAQKTAANMAKRSPLLMCVTLEQLRRSAGLTVSDCLRMERGMVRHCFTHGEVLEGIRALVVEKDNAPQWRPAQLSEVSDAMVQEFFAPVWPDYAHPLRELRG